MQQGFLGQQRDVFGIMLPVGIDCQRMRISAGPGFPESFAQGISLASVSASSTTVTGMGEAASRRWVSSVRPVVDDNDVGQHPICAHEDVFQRSGIVVCRNHSAQAHRRRGQDSESSAYRIDNWANNVSPLFNAALIL